MSKSIVLSTIISATVFVSSHVCNAAVHNCPAGEKLEVKVPDWTTNNVRNALYLEGMNFTQENTYLIPDNQNTKLNCHYLGNGVSYIRTITLPGNCKFEIPGPIDNYCEGSDCPVKCKE